MVNLIKYWTYSTYEKINRPCYHDLSTWSINLNHFSMQARPHHQSFRKNSSSLSSIGDPIWDKSN
jgi:hypothetical protein